MKRAALIILFLMICFTISGCVEDFFGKPADESFYDEKIIRARDKSKREYYLFSKNDIIVDMDIVEYYEISNYYDVSEDVGFELLNGNAPFITTIPWRGTIRDMFWYNSGSDYYDFLRDIRSRKFYGPLFDRTMTPYRVYGLYGSANKYYEKNIDDVVVELNSTDEFTAVDVIIHNWRSQ